MIKHFNIMPQIEVSYVGDFRIRRLEVFWDEPKIRNNKRRGADDLIPTEQIHLTNYIESFTVKE